MTPIEIVTGGENPTSGSTDVRVFAWHNQQERFLSDLIGVKMLNGQELMKINEPVYEPALVHHKPEIAGRWVSQMFLAPDDLILIIQANKKNHWQHAGTPARLIARIRTNAALREVSFATLALSASSRTNVPALKGRFDILSPVDAAKIGFVMNPLNRDHYTQDSVVVQFRTRILEPELQPAAKQTIVTTSSGERLVVEERTRDL